MASIRRGYSDDFTLKNNSVGIGTSTGQEALDVVDGAVKGQDLKVTGVSSFTAYEGFLRADQQIAENTTLSFDQGPSASLSGEIIVGTGVTVTIASVGLGTTMVGVGTHTIENTIDTTDATRAGGSEIECLKVYNTFTPPAGGTNERPYAPKPGELYYNYDFKTIEFFDGYGWRQVDNTTTAGRAYYFGGSHPGLPSTSQIEFVNLSTFGNAQYFGDLSIDMGRNAGCGSNVRGISAGGTPSGGDTIEYFTLSSSGSGADFGNLLASQNRFDACSSSTRGVFVGGNPVTNVMQYIQINTTGNAVDFGDLTQAREFPGSCSSPVRGICAGGNTPNITSLIDVFNIASVGNAKDFGDLVQVCREASAASNSVRGVIAGGYGDPARHNVMQYITIATNGNAEYFGDLSIAKSGMSGTGNQTRAVYFGCTGASPANTTTIDSILYSTTGSAVDFGDFTHGGLNGNRAFAAATSDSHGGLGGF